MTKLHQRLQFVLVFTAGDSLWVAQDEDGRDVYAGSDGTHPYSCEAGPYIIDLDVIKRDGCIWLGPSASGDSMVGHFTYQYQGKPSLVRYTLPVTLEIAKRLGVTEFGVRCNYSTGRRHEPGIFRLKGRQV